MTPSSIAERNCPFCGQRSVRSFGARGDAKFAKCLACHSVYRDLSSIEYSGVHSHAFTDESFVSGITGTMGVEPARELWQELRPFLPGRSLLEIGPGSGHLLAAAHEAGRVVNAVESSAVHRTFIEETWGLSTVYGSFSELPAGATFDAIVAVNTIEHIYDIDAFLHNVRDRLVPGGVFLLSTVNPAALSARLVRTYWSMFKPADHVSFPSPAGLKAAAGRAGLAVDEVWSGELPLETPISLVVAARDYVRERRAGPADATHDRGPLQESDSGGRAFSQKALQFAFRNTKRIDPTSRVLGRLGMASTIKATLRRPSG